MLLEAAIDLAMLFKTSPTEFLSMEAGELMRLQSAVASRVARMRNDSGGEE